MIFCASYENLGLIGLNLHNCDFDDLICKPPMVAIFDCNKMLIKRHAISFLGGGTRQFQLKGLIGKNLNQTIQFQKLLINVGQN